MIQDGTNSYTYGLDLVSALDGSGTRTYFLYDGLGSTVNLADGNGSSVVTYSYDVFGAIRSQTGSSPNYWLFTGEQSDGDSGLYYLRARYYDPATGRFLGRDPLPIGNRYSYVSNNPINLVDPLGLCGWSDPWDCVEDAGECVVNELDCVTDPILGAAEAIAPYALECAIWGGGALIATGGNLAGGAAGCATGVAARIIEDFVSNPWVECVVWAAGAFTVTRLAAGEALSAMTTRNVSIAGCVSGAGSWWLNELGLSNAGTQCADWGIPGAIAAPGGTIWELTAFLGGCLAGAADDLADPKE